jgi:hypothetical protein
VSWRFDGVNVTVIATCRYASRIDALALTPWILDDLDFLHSILSYAPSFNRAESSLVYAADSRPSPAYDYIMAVSALFGGCLITHATSCKILLAGAHSE